MSLESKQEKHQPASREWLVLVLLGAIALTVRLLFLSAWAANPLFHSPQGDEGNFHRTAVELLQDGDAGPSLYQPLYTFFLYLVYSVFGVNPALPRTLQLFIGVVTVLLFYGLGYRLGSWRDAHTARWTGRLSALLAALYGPQVFFEGMLLAPALTVPLCAGGLWALLSFRFRPHWLKTLLAGLLFGLALMDRPNLVLVLPVLVLWLFLKTPGRLRWVAPAVLGLGVVLGVAPSWIYNIRQGLWTVPVSPSGGHSFFIGNNPWATGTFHVPRQYPIDDSSHQAYQRSLQAIAEQSEGRTLTLSEVSSFWYRRGLEFWKEQPAEALALMGKKFLLALASEERPIHICYQFLAEQAGVLRFLLSFGIVLSFALAGALAVFSAPGRGLLFAGAAAYLCSLLLFYVADRYRMLLVPFLIPLAGLALVELYLAARSRAASFGGRVLVVLGSFILSQLMGMNEIQRRRALALDYNWQGKAAAELGNLEYSEKSFHKALENSGPSRAAAARVNLGLIYEMRGRADLAREQYIKAAANPSEKEARRRLARLAEGTGNLQEALRWWTELRSLEADPSQVDENIRRLQQILEKSTEGR